MSPAKQSILWLSTVAVVCAVPSPSTLGDISILAYDSLRPSDRNTTSAALLLKSPVNYQAAEAACGSLSESLWSATTEQPFVAGLNNSLSYEVYSGRASSDQLFWVAKEWQYHGGPPWSKRGSPAWQHGPPGPPNYGPHNPHGPPGCQAMLPSGDLRSIDCNTELPVLCTQSAPSSNSTFANTTASYQIVQNTGSQSLLGYRDFLTFHFLGVRFALEPKRFTYSTVYNAATGLNSALTDALQCLQPIGNGPGSTDCLFLNIWTTFLPGSSKPEPAALKPVMVYIYGGGFTTGSASNPTNDGGNLAARGDVVVVDLAYRLGALGTLAFNDGVHNGNYWISDQIAGLQWVQEHIADFGGDPSRVTIFGESAGAQSVQALIASSKARGLFHAAILQSTYVDTYLPISQSVNSFTLSILNETGCASAADQFACLESYNATALINLPTTANAPTIDGTYLITPFIDLNATAANKTTSSIPVMIGVNRDEAGVLNPQPVFTDVNASFYNLNPGEGIQSPPFKVIEAALSSGRFPLGPGPTGNDTLQNQVFNATTRFYTDYQLKCLSEQLAYTGVATGTWPDVFFYEFNRTYQPPGYNGNHVCQAPITPSHPNGDPEQEYFKCHAGDLELSFGNFARDGYPERDEYDIPFSQTVTDYWTAFARDLNPNPAPGYLAARGYWDTLRQQAVAGVWRPVNTTSPSMMLLQWNGAIVAFGDKSQCSVIGESLGGLLGQ